MTPAEFKSWRKGQRFTQKQAAEALGLNHRTIALYEAGERDGGKPVVIPRAVELACRALPPSPDSGEVVADMFWPTDDYETCLDDPADYADQSGEEALVFEVACAKKLPNEFVAARYVEEEGWIVSYHDTEAEADKALASPKS